MLAQQCTQSRHELLKCRITLCIWCGSLCLSLCNPNLDGGEGTRGTRVRYRHFSQPVQSEAVCMLRLHRVECGNPGTLVPFERRRRHCNTVLRNYCADYGSILARTDSVDQLRNMPLLTTVSTDLGTVWYGTRDVCLLVTTLVLDQPHAQCVTTPAPGCDALQQAIPRVRSNASRVSRPNSVHVSLFRCAQNPDWSCWWPQAVL
jgi:hypothetical protein